MKRASEIRAKLREHDLGRVADELVALLRPCVRLVTAAATETEKAAETRIGGAPALPGSVAWPRHDGRHLSFLGQVNLAQVAQLGLELEVPARGMFSFFLDQEGLAANGPTVDGARVMYFDDDSVVQPTPKGVPELRPCGVTLVPAWSLPAPSSSCPFIDQLRLSDDEDEAYQDFSSLRDEHLGAPAGHQLLGYGAVSDGDIHVNSELDTSPRRQELFEVVYPLGKPRERSEALDQLMVAARTWRLLLQFEQDPIARMGWWERGIAFMLREDALMAGRMTDVYWRLA